MELTQEQLEILRGYKTNLDDDNVRYKEIIKRNLIEDPIILYLLNNKELEDDEADPDDYIGVNILPGLIINPTQHNVKNYICYETIWKELIKHNGNVVKAQQIIFYIACEQATLVEKLTGCPRHDLIGARIKDMFNWTNKFGPQCHVVSENFYSLDTDFAERIITFELNTTNDLVKTRNNIPHVVNHFGA
jgi:hypothetical protein